MNIKVRNGYFQTNFKAELLLTNERTLKKNFKKSVYILLSTRDFLKIYDLLYFYHILSLVKLAAHDLILYFFDIWYFKDYGYCKSLQIYAYFKDC